MRMYSSELSALVIERGDGIAFALIIDAAEAFALQAVCALGKKNKEQAPTQRRTHIALDTPLT